jgi:tetratricopeptide (TPR) repeat protein
MHNASGAASAAPRAPKSLRSFSNAGLTYSARFWFAVTIAGQIAFGLYIVVFYGLSIVHGTLGDRARFVNHGYVAGDTLGNLTVALHLALGAIINLSGALQLVPGIRNRAPAFHRWNGRLFIGGSLIAATAGLYLIWVRGSVGDLAQHVASTLDALLIIAFAVLALRRAMQRNFGAHRRWALRLFMVVGGVWFFRIGFFLWVAINRGPVGFDPSTFTGPALTIATYAEYLVPLAILELYLRAQDRKNITLRLVAAGTVVAGTLVMIAGLLVVAGGAWAPAIAQAYENRTSIIEPLAATIRTSGVEAAVRQYQELKRDKPGTFDFGEKQLNALGYQLIGARKYDDAIRILALNVEGYPKSSNVYDSLGEAYMDAGDAAPAIANYRRSLALDPHNDNARKRLATLGAAPAP